MDKRDTERNDAQRRAEEERRDEQEYREEARNARPVSPEYQGEPLIFDELRDEPGPETPEERRVRGPYAAPVEEPPTGTELVGEGVGGASGGLVGAALGSLEQLPSEQLFQHLDARANRRLRDVHLARSVDEAARLGDHQEGACEIDVHVSRWVDERYKTYLSKFSIVVTGKFRL